MYNFKIGLQMYTVRDELREDFEGTVKKVADAGYEYVEFAGYYGGYSGKELRALLDKYGLKTVSVHQAIDMFDGQGQAAFDFFKDLGVHFLVIPWYDKNKLALTDEWDGTKKRFLDFAKKAQENGFEVLYHNHDFEFAKKKDGKYAYDIMFDELKGAVNPEPDTCWLSYGGVDPVEYLAKYGDRINVVHFKDYTCTKKNGGPVYALIDKDGNEIKPSMEETGFCFKPVGHGCLDWQGILDTAEKIGAQVAIVEQDQTGDMTPDEAIVASRKFLKEKFGV